MHGTKIRLAHPTDLPRLVSLRHALWPEGDLDAHREELRAIFSGALSEMYPYVILVAELPDGELAGFAEITLRSRADGCDPSRPVGYLEGWYVLEPYRRGGIGGELVAAFETWSREQGCIEVASDTWIDDEESQRAHEALGFLVVDRCVNYMKKL